MNAILNVDEKTFLFEKEESAIDMAKTMFRAGLMPTVNLFDGNMWVATVGAPYFKMDYEPCETHEEAVALEIKAAQMAANNFLVGRDSDGVEVDGLDSISKKIKGVVTILKKIREKNPYNRVFSEEKCEILAGCAALAGYKVRIGTESVKRLDDLLVDLGDFLDLAKKIVVRNGTTEKGETWYSVETEDHVYLKIGKLIMVTDNDEAGRASESQHVPLEILEVFEDVDYTFKVSRSK
jgi:hypothetical protein